MSNEAWCALVCRRADVPGVVRLLAAARAGGLAMRTVHPDAAGGVPVPDVVLPRLPSGGSLGRLAGWSAAPCVNGPAAIALTQDKPAALARLAASGVPVPPTAVVSRHAPSDLAGLSGERFVVKPVQGAAGRGVGVGWTLEEAAARAAAFADLSGPALVQPQLGGGVDRRLFLVDGELVAAMERRPDPEDGRGSLLYGATATSIAPSDDELRLARRAADALALDVAGVDLLVTDDGPLVLEVNACPGLKGIEAATGVDVAGAIIAACRRRLGGAS